MQVHRDLLAAKLSDPNLMGALSHFVRGRVPEAEVDDIVQQTIADALDADQHPEQDEEIVRWVHGICRHKVVDWFRRARREVPRDLESPEDGPVVAAESAPQSAMDLLRWAKKELPAGSENEKTLEWMLREGAGEKLEAIAAEANLPAPRVRQRVSRLRRHYKARWAAQAAALAALLLVALAVALALRQHPERVAPAPGPSLVPTDLAPLPPTAPPQPPQERPAESTGPQEPPAPAPSAPAPLPSDFGGSKMMGPKPVPTSMIIKPSPTEMTPPAPSASGAPFGVPPASSAAPPGPSGKAKPAAKKGPSKADWGSLDPSSAQPASKGDSK